MSQIGPHLAIILLRGDRVLGILWRRKTGKPKAPQIWSDPLNVPISLATFRHELGYCVSKWDFHSLEPATCTSTDPVLGPRGGNSAALEVTDFPKREGDQAQVGLPRLRALKVSPEGRNVP